MIDARFVPIDHWVGAPTKNRKVAPFSVAYEKTLRELERELRHLQAREVLIQAYLRDNQIRNDGWPRANERPSSPGIILTFTTPAGTLSFPCDTYAHYESNVRAISLSLTALRAIDRYGVTRRAEQYQGWKRIEPPSGQPFTTKQDAARFIVVQSAENDKPDFSLCAAIISDRELRTAAYRAAASKLHPDKPGGSHELFVRLQAAMRLLDGLGAGA
jgi:hypothetical protein